MEKIFLIILCNYTDYLNKYLQEMPVDWDLSEKENVC